MLRLSRLLLWKQALPKPSIYHIWACCGFSKSKQSIDSHMDLYASSGEPVKLFIDCDAGVDDAQGKLSRVSEAPSTRLPLIMAMLISTPIVTGLVLALRNARTLVTGVSAVHGNVVSTSDLEAQGSVAPDT